MCGDAMGCDKLKNSRPSDPIKAEDAFAKEKQTACTELAKKLKKSAKRFEERTTMLNSCKEWHKVHHQGLLLQSNLFRITKGMKEVTVSDWELDGQEQLFHLDPLASPQHQVAVYFKRSKKLHAGERHAERLLKEAEKELAWLYEQKAALDAVEDAESLANYFSLYKQNFKTTQKASAIKKKEPTRPYRVYRSQTGIEIWVGKSAKDNDTLTFHCAKGLDWWLHARNHPGSHVIIRCKKKQEPDEESLKDAAELALRYSKGKCSHEGEVCLTQVKALARVKGVPGKVTLSKHRLLHVALDNKRWERLNLKTAVKGMTF